LNEEWKGELELPLVTSKKRNSFFYFPREGKMKRLIFFVISFLLISKGAFSAPIPELLPTGSESGPAAIEPEFPPQPEQQPPPEVRAAAPIKHIKRIRALQRLSGVAYYTLMRDWGLMPPKSKSRTQAYPAVEGLAPASSVYATINMTSDSYRDVEPSVMGYNNNGTVYISTVYLKYLADGNPRNYYSMTPDEGATFYRGQLPMPAGYLYSGDPLMAKNPYNGGAGPERIYASGTAFNSAPPNAIAVWHTDNGGFSWSQPTVAAVNNNSAYILDKPAATVSWYSGTLGHVYVAYEKVDLVNKPPQTQFFVTKSTDGGLSFGTPVLVTTGNIEGPQILVNNYNGYVYAIWMDYTLNAVRMSTSTDFGQTWSSPETAATGNMFSDPNNHLNGALRAYSLPMARFNWVANKICIVWHERQQAGSSLADVYYTAKSPSGWQAKVMLNDVQTNDQFMPALDFDSTGNLIVTFYDRRDDPNNILYHEYMAHIDSNGNLLEPNARVSTFQSNPQNYPHSFIGDYQDIWDQSFSSGEFYLSAWVGIPNVGDIYLSGIQP
jgi:hypothetical protein